MERNSEEKSDKYRVNLGVWQPKIGRSFAIWQFGRTFGFPKDENSANLRILFGFPLPRTHANECYYRRELIHTQIITDDDLRRLYEAVKTKDISKLTPKQRLIYSFYLRSNVEMGGAALF